MDYLVAPKGHCRGPQSGLRVLVLAAPTMVTCCPDRGATFYVTTECSAPVSTVNMTVWPPTFTWTMGSWGPSWIELVFPSRNLLLPGRSGRPLVGLPRSGWVEQKLLASPSDSWGTQFSSATIPCRRHIGPVSGARYFLVL